MTNRPEQPAQCGCEACLKLLPDDGNPIPRHLRHMIVCAICGNKRCPHAADHRFKCTGSNEPGQIGQPEPFASFMAAHRFLGAAYDAAFVRCRDAIARFIKSREEIEQILGKAMKYPKFCDDQKSFPGATVADGVCVGDHVAESLAEEAAKTIARLERELAEAKAENSQWLRRHKNASEAAGEMNTRQLRESLAIEQTACVYWQQKLITAEARIAELTAEVEKLTPKVIAAAKRLRESLAHDRPPFMYCIPIPGVPGEFISGPSDVRMLIDGIPTNPKPSEAK